MKAALAKGVASGALVQVKSSYKVSPEAKKAAPKAAKAKKDTEKKAEEKKKKVSAMISPVDGLLMSSHTVSVMR